MPRRKVIRTTKEEEEFQRTKRERKAKWQAEKREKTRMITKESDQSSLNTGEFYSNILQPSTSFSKNIVIDSNISINSSKKIIYSVSQTTTLQTIHSSAINNVSMTKNSNEIAITSDNMKVVNVNNVKISQNDDLNMKTLSNSNIISSVATTSKLININNNEFIDLTNLNEISHNNLINDMSFNKSESRFSTYNITNKNKIANCIKKTRALRKGYTTINRSYITSLQNILEHYIGEMNIRCEHCGAKHFNSEKIMNKGNSFHDCCNHGSVKLDPLPQPPHELYELFIGSHSKSKHFYNRIRGYNNTFSFASFNANICNFNTQRRGPYCFKIQGQIYYQINTALYPATNEMPSYGQLFIVDNNEATECRLHQNSNLDKEILHLIDNIMRTKNIFAQSYRMMHEEIQSQQQTTGISRIHELHLGFLTKKRH